MGNTNSFSIWLLDLRHLKCLHYLLLLIFWAMAMPRSLTLPASQKTKSPFLTELQSKETTEASEVRGNKCTDPKHVQEEINQSPKQASIPIQKHTFKMPTLNRWQGAVKSTSYCLPGLHNMSQIQPVLPPPLPGWQGHFRLTSFFQWRSMNSPCVGIQSWYP